MSKMRLTTVVALLGASSGAWADKPKYTRPQDVKIDVKLSDRSKPIVTDPKAKSEFKPELSADAVLSVEGLVGEIRSEQESILAKLIIDTPDSEVEEKSDYYFRLGELYAKQQRYYRLNGIEAQIASDQAKDPAQKAKLKTDAERGQGRAKEFLIKAVKTYKALTDNEAFRNYPKMDM